MNKEQLKITAEAYALAVIGIGRWALHEAGLVRPKTKVKEANITYAKDTRSS